jgi:hypothetical protein
MGFCEEFTSHLYEDAKHNSILANIPGEWFDVFNKGMERRHYKLIHMTAMPKTLTVVYAKA